MRKKYPGTYEAEKQRGKTTAPPLDDTEPDFVYPGVPNYDKFKGWTAEEVLVWLNVD